MRYGSKHKFGAVNYHMMMMLGQTLTLKDKAEFQVNDKLKVSFTGVYDVLEVTTKGESANITFGVSAELKI